MLVLWTVATESSLNDVVGPIVSKYQVDNRITYEPDTLPSYSPGDVILVFGTKLVEVLQKLGVVAKGRTVTSLRENVIEYNGGKFLITFDPGLVSRDYARRPEIQWDIQLAIRLHQTGSTVPELGNYEHVESLHEIIQEVVDRYELTQANVPVSCDIETTGLDEYRVGAYIISISFTVKFGHAQVLYFKKDEQPIEPPPWKRPGECNYWERLWIQIHWLLTDTRINLRGANFKYDSRWINHKWSILCTNQTFDTMLVGSLLDENRSNSLKLHAKIMTSMGGYDDPMKKHDMAHLELVPMDEIVLYNGGDTDATHRVADVQRVELLKNKRLTNFYTKLVQPSVRVFEKMERNGINIDLPYYNSLKVELSGELTHLHSEMLALIPATIKHKYKDDLKITRPALLKDFLFSKAGLNLKPKLLTEKTKEASTAMDHLMQFEDNPQAKEFISLLGEYNIASKTLSTYVVGFLKHLRSDGKFHPTYHLARGEYGNKGKDDAGTVTGRCLVAKTLIITDKGEIFLEEIVSRFAMGEKFYVLTHRNKWQEVTAVYNNGVKPIYRVTAGVHAIECTGNHPVMSFPTWKLTDDLIPGDMVYSVVKPPQEELWMGIPQWPFEVSNLGRVRRSIDGHNVKAGQMVPLLPKGKWGHKRVSITRFTPERDKWDAPVHRLVALAFIGEPPEGKPEVSHRNGDAGCNWVTNLEWVSVEENRRVMTLHGTADHGNQKKMTWGGVDEIRACPSINDSVFAEKFGVSRELVRDIRLFKRWTGRRDSMVGFVPVAVESVEYVGMLSTYDLSVAEDHSFIANGLVVHNTSASDPAVQTLTKHNKWAKRLRRAFIAPPGYRILNADYSQGELKIAACQAKEPTMIQAYLDKKDLHSITAAGLNGYELSEFMALPEDVMDALRSSGKAGNFGLLYGMQHIGFQAYAKASYGVSMTEEEAFKAREAFFALYTRLAPWHEECKNIARMYGQVVSPLGRIRHLPLISSKDREARSAAERQAINSPIQATLSDLMQLAMVNIDLRYNHTPIQMFLMTHDSVSLLVPEDDAEEWAQRVKSTMESLELKRDFYWEPELVFTADAELSYPDTDGIHSLASLKKVKGLY